MKTSTFKTYIKNGQSVIADSSNLFVYETTVLVRFKNYYSMVNKKYYSSPKEIESVVGSFWKNKYTQICSELFSAPEQWLIDNGYVEYQNTK